MLIHLCAVHVCVCIIMAEFNSEWQRNVACTVLVDPSLGQALLWIIIITIIPSSNRGYGVMEAFATHCLTTPLIPKDGGNCSAQRRPGHATAPWESPIWHCPSWDIWGKAVTLCVGSEGQCFWFSSRMSGPGLWLIHRLGWFIRK